MMIFSLGRLQATMQMSSLDWFAEERDLIFRWLKSLAFFQQTPGIDIRAIAKHMQITSHFEGEVIQNFNESQGADQTSKSRPFYIVMSGSVVELADSQRGESASNYEATLGPGDTFNEPLSEWESANRSTTRSQRRMYEARKVVVREDNTMLCSFSHPIYCAAIMPHTLGVLMRPCMLQRYLRLTQEQRTPAKTEQIAQQVSKMDIFNNVPPNTLRLMLMCLKYEECGLGEVVVAQGDVPDALYIIIQGSIEVRVQGTIRRKVPLKINFMFLLPILNLSFSLSPSHVQGSTRKDMRPVDYDENARALKSRFRTTTGMAESAFGKKVVELGVGNAFGEVGLELVDKPYRNANVISCSSRSCFAVMASADYRTLLGVHKQHMVFQPRQLQVRYFFIQIHFPKIIQKSKNVRAPTHPLLLPMVGPHCKPVLRRHG